MRLKIILEPQRERGYTVHVPALPGCISQGETQKQAIRNIREAIQLYLEPIEDESLLGRKGVVKELVI